VRNVLGIATLFVALGAARAPAAGAGLPPAPFTLEARGVRIGDTEAARLIPRAGAPAAMDVFLVRIPSGPPALTYFVPDTGWSSTPAAMHRGAPDGGPLVARWRETGPAGFISLVAIFTRPGGAPVARQDWVYQPLVARVRIASAPASRRETARRLGALGAATAAGLAVLARWPVDRRAP
jgi:hypothetical protein